MQQLASRLGAQQVSAPVDARGHVGSGGGGGKADDKAVAELYRLVHALNQSKGSLPTFVQG